MLRAIGAAALMVLAAGGALADEAALLIANGRYVDGDRVRGAGDLVTARDALDGAGIATLSDTDSDRQEMLGLLRDFAGIASGADGLVIALSGQFVHTDRETWFLPTDSDDRALVETAMRALPLSLVFAILSQTPERAILALSPHEGEVETGPGPVAWLGVLDPPSRVTVIRGDAAAMADFLGGTIAVPGASMAERLGHDEALTGAAEAEQRLRALRGEDRAVSAEEQRSWNVAQERGRPGAYRAYIEAWPNGLYMDEAGRALAALRDEQRTDPEIVAAREGEAALGFSDFTRRAIEKRLQAFDLAPGPVDSTFDAETRRGIRRYQRAADLPVTGYMSQQTTVRLLADSIRDVMR